MPNMAAFTINDGSNDIAFRPDSVTPTNTLFYEDDAQKSLAELAKVNYDRPTKGNTLRRTIRINVPVKVMEGTAEEQTVWMSARTEFVIDNRVSSADRQRLVNLQSSLVAGTTTAPVVVTPEWFW